MSNNIQTAYPDAIPFMSPAAATLQAELGPKCAECGKAHRLSKEAGGCACPRFTKRKGELQSHKTMQLRQVEASERLNQLLEAYLSSHGVALPIPVEGIVTVAVEPTGTVVDNIRAKHEVTRKVS